MGDDVIYDNAIINCPELAFGKFNCVDCNVGIDSGIILTNGSASNIIGPNNSGSTTTDNFWPGDSDLDAVLVCWALKMHVFLNLICMPQVTV